MKKLSSVVVTAANRDGIARAAWAVALRLRSFAYADISAAMSIGMDATTVIVRQWEADSKVVAVRKSTGRKIYRVADAPALPDERDGDPLMNIWTGMRKLGQFSPTDLAAHANAGLVFVSRVDAAAYCTALLQAGYLRVVTRAVPGQREAVYRLIRDHGPKPPRERRVKALFDPNLDELTFVEGFALPSDRHCGRDGHRGRGAQGGSQP